MKHATSSQNTSLAICLAILMWTPTKNAQGRQEGQKIINKEFHEKCLKMWKEGVAINYWINAPNIGTHTMNYGENNKHTSLSSIYQYLILCILVILLAFLLSICPNHLKTLCFTFKATLPSFHTTPWQINFLYHSLFVLHIISRNLSPQLVLFLIFCDCKPLCHSRSSW